MYSKVVINLLNNPKNAGRISKPDGIADVFNLDSTAHVEFSLRIENGVITDCKFRAQANPYIIAICSTMTMMAKGKMVSMIFFDPYSIKKELGDESDYNIDFCIDCFKLAIIDYKEKLSKQNKELDDKIEETEQVVTIKESEEVIQTETTTEEKQDSDSDDDFDFSDFFDDEDMDI